VSFEQVGASLAGMTAQGTPTAQATTQLNSLIAEIGKNGTTAATNFAKFTGNIKEGGLTFAEAMEMGWDLSDVLAVMQQGADESGVSMVDMFSSIEAGKAALAISSSDWVGNLEAMSEEADVVSEGYSTMADTLQTKSAVMKESWTNLLVAFTTGGDVQTAFENLGSAVFSWLDGLLPMLGNLVSGLPKVLKGLFTQVRKFVKKRLPEMLKSGVQIAGGLVEGLVQGLPDMVTGLADGIGELLPALVSTGTDLLKNVAGGLISSLPNVLGSVFTALENLIPTLMDLLPGLISTVTRMFWSLQAKFLSVVREFVPQLLSRAAGLVGQVVQRISDALNEKFPAVGKVFDTVVGFVKGAFDGLVNFWNNTLGPAVSAVAGWFTGLFEAGAEGGLSGLADYIKTTFAEAWGKFTDWFSQTKIGQALTNVGNWFGGLVKAGQEGGISGVAEYISGSFAEAWGNFTDWFADTGIGQALTNVGGWFGGLIDSADGGLSGVAGYITGTFSKAWGKFGTWFADTTIGKALTDVGSWFSGLFEEGGPLKGVSDFITDTFGPAWDGIENLFKEGGTLDNAISGVKDWFGGLLGSAQEGGLTGVVTYLEGSYTSAWNELATTVFGEDSEVSKAVARVTGWLDGLFEAGSNSGLSGVVDYLGDSFANAWTDFTEIFADGSGVKEALDNVSGWFGGLIGAAKEGGLKGVAGYLNTSFKSAWTGFTGLFTEGGAIQTAFSNAGDWFKGLLGAANEGGLAGVAEYVKGTLVSAWDGFTGLFADGSGIKTALDNAGTWFGGLLGSAEEGGLKGIGEYLAGSFTDAWNGISGIFGQGSVLGQGIDRVKGWFSEMTGDGGPLKGVYDFLTGTFSNAWKDLQELLCPEDQSSGIYGAISRIGKAFTSLKDNYLVPVKNYVADKLTKAWDGLKGMFGGLVTWLKETFTVDWTAVWDGISEAFATVWEGFKGIALTPINAIIGFLNSLVNGVKNALNSMITGINDLFSFTIGPIELPFIGEVVPETDVKLADIPLVPWPDNPIPELAAGGILSSGSAIIAEAGPELLSMQGNQAVVQPLTANARNYSAWESGGEGEMRQLIRETRETMAALPGMLANIGVYLDGDTLVGGITAPMNQALGREAVYTRRRN
jgi:phage-related protein